ncbi:MAG: hypothetical protein KO206_06465, partial [Methanomicrobiaceae archaeon]|nr:hypothetical protein [Methanomicrobiaceae archaeon]
MTGRILGLLVLGLLLLATGAAALAPEEIAVSSSKEWVVADGSDSAAITVEILNASTTVDRVEFSVDAAYGNISGGGTASATFKAATKSGTAPIQIRVRYLEGGEAHEVETVYDQKIDHDTPYQISYIDYDDEATVGETTDIVIGISDRHGNPVDNRRTAETVRFSVGSPSGDAGFLNGSVYESEIALPVDGTGHVTATLRVDTVAGENIVQVEPPSPVPDRYLTVFGIGNGMPHAIELAVAPYGNPIPFVPADGASVFTLTYTLYDEFGGPTADRALRITAEPGGEVKVLNSSSTGKVIISYGPRSTIGTVTITATAVDNESVTIAQQLEFHATDPVDMLLTASPQTMPSLDVDGSLRSSVRAKVIDVKGNPVQGQEVSFRIENIDHGGFNWTSDPDLDATTAVTNENGHAIVQFSPGAFERENVAATGSCDVIAEWENANKTIHVTRTIRLTWKNYPFLSAMTSVTPETVEVNQTVDVGITLVGDGWALQPDPIDVILCTDRSGSMLYDNPDRMHSAREAAKILVGQLSENRDQV